MKTDEDELELHTDICPNTDICDSQEGASSVFGGLDNSQADWVHELPSDIHHYSELSDTHDNEIFMNDLGSSFDFSDHGDDPAQFKEDVLSSEPIHTDLFESHQSSSMLFEDEVEEDTQTTAQNVSAFTSFSIHGLFDFDPHGLEILECYRGHLKVCSPLFFWLKLISD